MGETWVHEPNQYPVFITSKRSVSMPPRYLIRLQRKGKLWTKGSQVT